MLINAKENRDVVRVGVVGVYLIATIKVYVIVRLSGESVDIMYAGIPEYKLFVANEKGKKVMYMQLLKALYGCM